MERNEKKNNNSFINLCGDDLFLFQREACVNCIQVKQAFVKNPTTVNG